MKTYVILLIALLAACHGKKESPAADPAESTAPFVVKDASEGLLFTWIDEKGDFHVEQKAGDVPLVGRDAVRVVDPSREDGTHAGRVFLADLRTAKADGSYAVKVITRAEFDGLALARRRGKTATLEGSDGGNPASPIPAPPGADPGSTEPGAPVNQAGRPAVIIYGASWCGACHDAARYLRGKGISFVEKDIETDLGAAREMQAKLAKAGLRGGSIPVLDVRGKVMVGFSPQAVDDALGKAL